MRFKYFAIVMLKVNYMPTQTEIALNAFEAPRATSVYPSMGKAYLRHAHSFSASPRIVRTGKSYYDSQKVLAEMIERGELPADARFMTQAEGFDIENSYKARAKDPRKAPEFDDYFARNKDKTYLWEWTSNGLRVPKGWENGRIDTDGKYPRILLAGDKEGGEVKVPVGNGRVIVESDGVSGIPIETREIAWPHEGYHSHWHFNPSPSLDNVSCHYDVAVGRGGGWLRDEGGRCLVVDAGCGRSGAVSDDGFRPVRGSVPEIEIVSSSVDVEQVRQEILGRARAEFARDVKIGRAHV